MKRNKFFIVLVALAAAFLLTSCGAVDTTGWETQKPGGDTICSDGSPYAYFTRKTESKNLLVYFQAGGGCAANFPCDPQNPQMFDPTVHIPDDDSTKGSFMWDTDHPAQLGGIFDLDDERNPFREYNILYVPYCTGDLGIGNNVDRNVNHKGYINNSSALEWAYKNITDPEKVFVAGSSSGAVTAAFFMGFLTEKYPNAQIAVLSDTSGAYLFDISETLENWGATEVMQNEFGFSDVPVENLDFDTPTLVYGARYPKITFARFDAVKDSTEQMFLSQSSGTDITLAEALANSHTALRVALPNFRTYSTDGTYHTILADSRFYKESVNGVLFYQWVTDLANGVDVENVAP